MLQFNIIIYTCFTTLCQDLSFILYAAIMQLIRKGSINRCFAWSMNIVLSCFKHFSCCSFLLSCVFCLSVWDHRGTSIVLISTKGETKKTVNDTKVSFVCAVFILKNQLQIDWNRIEIACTGWLYSDYYYCCCGATQFHWKNVVERTMHFKRPQKV